MSTSRAELDVYRCPLDGIQLIEASAGSGKTWNLCGLYLRLLLERQLEVQRILVVTFTNAATAELKERIRARIAETLEYLNRSEDSAASADPFVPRLLEELTQRQGLDPEHLARRLDLALQTFDEAAIFTIHSFCQRALADAPFAAGVPMVLELTRDDAAWRLSAVQDFWRRRIAGDALSPALASYLLEQNDSPEKYAALLQRHLAKPLARAIWPEDLNQVSPADATGREWSQAYAQARDLWLAQAEEIQRSVVNALDQLNANIYKPDSLKAGAAEWDELFRSEAPASPRGDKLDLYRTAKLVKSAKKNCTPPQHPFFDAAETWRSLGEKLDQELARARLRLIRDLLEEAAQALRELKRSERVVAFDDMLFNLYERLSGDACPWLAGSLKARFPAALIDEFQDTDPLQFAIFQHIYGAGDAPLFLVGDPKQAIYSFRNADLHTYLRARQTARNEYSLVANQRSSRGLLAALNALFSANDRAFLLKGLDYHPVEYGSKPRKSFQDRSEPRGDLHLWMLHAEDAAPPDKAAARDAAVAATAGEIARLLNAGAAGAITLEGRSLAPGDIAVLVRSHAQGSLIKRALAELRVGSVELSQASVFHSVDAEEVERVLRAVLEPGREGLLRAALSSELLGRNALDIATLMTDETRLLAAMEQFNRLREIWRLRGFGVMFRRLLNDERVAERLLTRPDGERRLTNFLHLAECLHQAGRDHPSPEALLRHLESLRRDDSENEAAQLRLESDQNLVRIVTIHKSKGLEYPIVFCPFLWNGRAPGGPGLEGQEYHDSDGQPVIDWCAPDAGKDSIRLEKAAEDLRLIYVALTRAVYRCYLVVGSYSVSAFGRPSSTESGRSMLNWLAAGAGQQVADWFNGKPAPQEIHRAWAALAATDSIRLSLPPADAGVCFTPEADNPARFTCRAAPAGIAPGWQISSYSGLSRNAVASAEGDSAASDHDARIRPAPEAAPPDLPPDDILRFPKGPTAGDCIHALFERLDFSNDAAWADAITQALADFAPADSGAQSRLRRMLQNLARDVCGTELLPGLRLSSVTLDRRLTEMEFNLPAHRLAADALNRLLTSRGYPGPRLSFGRLQGYLKGFIDLVFEHQGRYYVLDWKSNHLGHQPAAYAPESLAEAMAQHGYHLQSLLYSVALDRHLARRIPDYRFEQHFGGSLYLFVRGVRPAWQNPDQTPAGVYFHRPQPDTLAALNALFDAPAVAQASL